MKKDENAMKKNELEKTLKKYEIEGNTLHEEYMKAKRSLTPIKYYKRLMSLMKSKPENEYQEEFITYAKEKAWNSIPMNK
jgi:hypothetical protein